MIKHVDHFDIVSKRVKETIEFYKKVGFEVAGTVDDGKVTVLKGGPEKSPIFIELTDAEWHGLTGIDHISFVVDDVDEMFEELKDNVRLEDKAVWFAEGSGRRAFKVLDPNGILLQFTVVKSGYKWDKKK